MPDLPAIDSWVRVQTPYRGIWEGRVTRHARAPGCFFFMPKRINNQDLPAGHYESLNEARAFAVDIVEEKDLPWLQPAPPPEEDEPVPPIEVPEPARLWNAQSHTKSTPSPKRKVVPRHPVVVDAGEDPPKPVEAVIPPELKAEEPPPAPQKRARRRIDDLHEGPTDGQDETGPQGPSNP